MTSGTDTSDVTTANIRALGPALGMAERTLTRGLRSVLAETGTPTDTWYAFQRLSVSSAAPTAAAFRADLSDSLDLDGPAAAALLDGIVAAGLMHEVSDPAGGDPRIAFTPAGVDLQARIRASLAAGTGELIAPFAPADIETTIRTLTALTERARLLHGDAR
jgi:DNA-binding MarR family transcriptional regulator